MRSHHAPEDLLVAERRPDVTHHRGRSSRGGSWWPPVELPRLMRAARRATFCAITRIASQAPFGRLRIGGKNARGEMVEPHAVLEVSDDALNLGVPAMVGFQFQSVIPSRSVMQP